MATASAAAARPLTYTPKSAGATLLIDQPHLLTRFPTSIKISVRGCAGSPDRALCWEKHSRSFHSASCLLGEQPLFPPSLQIPSKITFNFFHKSRNGSGQGGLVPPGCPGPTKRPSGPRSMCPRSESVFPSSAHSGAVSFLRRWKRLWDSSACCQPPAGTGRPPEPLAWLRVHEKIHL